MRVIVGAVTGIFVSLYLMYYIFPLLVSTHSNFSTVLNGSDPVIASSFTMGAGFYSLIPFIPVLIGGFIIISMALKNGPDDQ